MQYNTFYERLREERKRIGLTQADFGAIGGVKKLAQANYENGSRQPTVEYIDRLRNNPLIDVDYIFSGLRDNNERKRAYACSRVNCLIAMALDLDPAAFEKADDEAYNQEVTGSISSDFNADDVIEDKHLTVENIVYSTVDNSPRLTDFKLLEGVIVQLELLLIEANLKITPEKKAAAITMLYRSFRATGKVDQKAIKDTIKLAST